MSGNQDGDRTESATPKRRREARKQGQVARSMELNSVLVLGAGVFLILWGAGWMGRHLLGVSRFYLGEMAFVRVGDGAEAGRMMVLGLREMAYALAPLLLGTFVIGTAAALGQVGWAFSLEALSFRFEKLNPVEGLKNRLFSKQALFELAKNLAKVALLGVVAAVALKASLPRLIGLALLEFDAGWSEGTRLIASLVLRMLGALAVLAAVDFWWQRHRTEEQLKMTKEEVKREHKDSEGDPQIKARIRGLMMQSARRRMIDDVAQADVVVTNPTHFSVALAYSPEEPAPKVVAKGQGFLALRIREVAHENGVPVIEEPPLARALYRATRVGDMIPIELFEPVARVLAAVMKASQRVAGHSRGGE